MVEEKAPPKRGTEKQGLHGWKAAAAVFGCGTLAAFGFFGVLVMIAGFIIDTTSSGIDDPEYSSGVEQTGEPREELEPGGLDICNEYLPQISDIQISESGPSDHSDDALESNFSANERRTVAGACSFVVTPMYGTTASWSFDLSYYVIVHDPDADRDQLASDLHAEELESAKSQFASVESTSEHSWADSSHSFYGTASDSASQYTVVSQTRSAVYTVTFSGDRAGVENGAVPEDDFERQARDLVERLQGRFFRVIPR